MSSDELVGLQQAIEKARTVLSSALFSHQMLPCWQLGSLPIYQVKISVVLLLMNSDPVRVVESRLKLAIHPI